MRLILKHLNLSQTKSLTLHPLTTHEHSAEEMILEDLFDETVTELIQSGNYLNFDKNVMYSIAEKITREKFDDLCQ